MHATTLSSNCFRISTAVVDVTRVLAIDAIFFGLYFGSDGIYFWTEFVSGLNLSVKWFGFWTVFDFILNSSQKITRNTSQNSTILRPISHCSIEIIFTGSEFHWNNELYQNEFNSSEIYGHNSIKNWWYLLTSTVQSTLMHYYNLYLMIMMELFLFIVFAQWDIRRNYTNVMQCLHSMENGDKYRIINDNCSWWNGKNIHSRSSIMLT